MSEPDIRLPKATGQRKRLLLILLVAFGIGGGCILATGGSFVLGYLQGLSKGIEQVQSGGNEVQSLRDQVESLRDVVKREQLLRRADAELLRQRNNLLLARYRALKREHVHLGGKLDWPERQD
jgi:hypothetical protein